MSGVSPVTTTVSVSAPTSMVIGGRARRSPALTAMPVVFGS